MVYRTFQPVRRALSATTGLTVDPIPNWTATLEPGREARMQSKWGTKAKRSEKVDQQRRKVIKLMGAAGAGAIASPWMFQSSRAASKTIKIGMVTPGDRPDRRLRRAVAMGRRGRAQAACRRHHGRRAEIQSGRDHHQGQPVQPEPGVGSHGAAHQQRQSRHHDRIVDLRHGQSGLRPMRARRRTVHHLGRSLAGLVLPAQRRSQEGLRVDLPFLLGLRHGRQYRSPTCG